MSFFDLTSTQFLLVLAGVLLVMGVLLIIIGVIVLVSRVLGGDLKKIAEQTATLAQKGIAEEVAGLVGNASTLVEALNGLIKSAAGIGVFLILIGLVFMAAAYGLVLQLR